jgi:hypothetical protein
METPDARVNVGCQRAGGRYGHVTPFLKVLDTSFEPLACLSALKGSISRCIRKKELTVCPLGYSVLYPLTLLCVGYPIHIGARHLVEI